MGLGPPIDIYGFGGPEPILNEDRGMTKLLFFRAASVLACTIAIITPYYSASAANKLIVHEWGTLTTLHIADGTALGGLNRIDPREVLPDFVHRLPQPALQGLAKGANQPGHPDVIMRLETPVIYFYPQAGFDPKRRLDVQVRMQGGLLDEYYPDALWKHNLKPSRGAKTLHTGSESRLTWRKLRLDADVEGPETIHPQWLAPRAVKAHGVRTASGEVERYLFYRGVAHLRAPLQTTHDTAARRVSLFSPKRYPSVATGRLHIERAWLMHVRADGRLAYRSLGPYLLTPDPQHLLERSSALFADADYQVKLTATLRAEIQQALVTAGLYTDEAQAMLATWGHSYFEQPGLRLLYLVPRPWIDHYLPLTISIKSDVQRVFIGRIDFAI